MSQLPKQTDCEMSKLMFCQSHWLTYYHATDGLSLISSVGFNTSLCEHNNLLGSVACYYRVLAVHNCDTAIKSIVDMVSKYGKSNLPRQL